MVTYIKLIFLIVFLFSSFFKNVFSLESAVHRAEVAKCVNLSSLIYNSNPISENLSSLALHVHKLSLIKSENLEISELTIKEIKPETEKKVILLIKNNNNSRMKELLGYCIQTLRIGN